MWNHIYCDPTRHFVYFRIPKAANSTVAKALHAQVSQSGKPKRAGRQFAQSGIWTRRQLERQFTFTFVRNPFARVLSCYLDKVVDGSPKFTSLLGGKIADFPAFLAALEKGALRANGHWAPQDELIPLAPQRLGFIGRVESIEADLPLVLGRIFGTREYAVPQSPFRTTSADARLAAFYGPKETAQVRRLYARDFALFYPDAADP